jgi:hypothetical protein
MVLIYGCGFAAVNLWSSIKFEEMSIQSIIYSANLKKIFWTNAFIIIFLFVEIQYHNEQLFTTKKRQLSNYNFL